MSNVTSWTNRRYIFLGAVLVILVNEVTLQIFDKNPPIHPDTLWAIRVLDFVIILGAFTAKRLFHLVKYIRSVSNFFVSYVMPSMLAIILLDVSLGLIGFGYPSQYEQENIGRFPNPSDSFRGKPNVHDHNEFGFRGEFPNSRDSYNVAMFGGSTTYYGKPPIIELVHNIISDQGIDIEVFNFGSLSSNHTQHVHRLLEFSDRFKFDLVIFYGGHNETLQYAIYDPRPGYPYNFFFRNELNPLMQSLLRYSSILGTLDLVLGGSLSGLKKLKLAFMDSNWKNEIVANYWRDLTLASELVTHIVEPNMCKKPSFLGITQPGNPNTQIESQVWTQLIESATTFNLAWRHVDLSEMAAEVEFTDIIHLTQNSRAIMASEIASIVEEVYQENCR
jgi:hypothetical protein